jgi:hypothetical protein
MKYILYIVLSVFLVGCASTSVWTREEIHAWYMKNVHTLPDPASPVRYRGTDERYHYLLIRDKDSWRNIKVNKEEIHINDVRPVSTYIDNGHLGYYAVDILNGYEKVR